MRRHFEDILAADCAKNMEARFRGKKGDDRIAAVTKSIKLSRTERQVAVELLPVAGFEGDDPAT